MLETVRQKFAFLVAIVFATVVGSISTAFVMAAIPGSNGTISGCYDNKGSLRVIDTEAGSSCKNQETPLNWGTSGSSGNVNIAYAATADGVSLDSTYSENIVDYKVIPGYFWPTGNEPVGTTACIKVAFEPRFIHTMADNEVATSGGYVSGKGLDVAQFIESICGEGFNVSFSASDDPPMTEYKLVIL